VYELERSGLSFAGTGGRIRSSSWAGTSGTGAGAVSAVEVDTRGSLSLLRRLLRLLLRLRLLRLKMLNLEESRGDPFSGFMSAASALFDSLLALRALSRSAASCFIWACRC